MGQRGGESTVLSFLAFIFALGLLIIVHEFGHFFVAKRYGVKVERFSIGFGPKIFGVKKGDTEYTVSLIPLGGYVKMAGETCEDDIKGEKWEYLSQAPGRRFNILFAGPLLNYILAFLIFSLIFMIGSPALSTKVGELLDGYPAKDSGIKVGDRIVAVDGKSVVYWEDLTNEIHKKFNKKITFTIKKDDREFQATIETKTKEVENIFGQKMQIALIGIAPSDELLTMKFNPIKSFYVGGKKLIGLTGLTYKALWMMITGGLSPKELTGPIGIYVITGKAAQLGFIYFINIIAVISFNLALFNLLPLPILDGGHIFFLGLEKLRGRPLSKRKQELITQIGLTFIIFIAIAVSYNDIMKFGVFEKLKGLFKR
ncbi:MAG: RIP metalloprotease RseP [Candidatus Omnitrophica bacterium CG07_land_8_20_14_0_80_42_15]|uniref:Zinc metalloprotease n=1 Tax=Candidatus Aquitaenariimonas noxiae TaxID=1974741 RepID=A0A2J0KVM4_9BACT|nr:MAG: RIP metalloprotease RseP [Candidatus Omnitrophica bacterium CG07_land_8_20_14_0_80_42_15]